jgi:hypothetical protein
MDAARGPLPSLGATLSPEYGTLWSARRRASPVKAPTRAATSSFG